MADDTLTEAAGARVGGPLPAALDMPAFEIRKVLPPTAQERQTRRDAMERAIKHGAEPYRDAEGQARYVFFREANNAPVEAWRRDREAKRGFRRTQQARKAAGQLIWHPEDQIELAKRLGVIYHREGRSAEGAAERGLYDAIWRYEHIWDSFTVPRRFGRDTLETGRIAAVAEEEARKLQAEDPKARGGFWVRDRKNNGLIYVVPNPDPMTLARSNDAKEDDLLLGGEGADVVIGQVDDGPELDQVGVTEPEPSPETSSTSQGSAPLKLSYPDIALPTLEPTWILPQNSTSKGSELPVINMEQDRIKNILANEPAIFEIEESPRAHSSEPWYEFHGVGYAAVWVYQDVIEYEARRQGVDPDLVKAIVYLENARGASYGRAAEALDKPLEALPGDPIPWRFADSILPMNIQENTWEGLVGRGENFRDPLVNIKAGIVLIRRIIERLTAPTVAKVASIYNFTGYENVNDNGAAVAAFYETRPWERPPDGMTSQHEKYYLRQRNALRRRLPRN